MIQTHHFVALTGNPNSGKTTLFNVLTGLRAKVGNYAGVTVERKEGALKGSKDVTIIDLPGTYSLSPKSLDEQVSRDVLFHRVVDVPAPELVVVVVDASNLERNLYYATQVIELGYPTIVALNMIDVAEENGHQIDDQKLAEELGVPVVPLIASKGTGVPALKEKIAELLKSVRSGRGAPPRVGKVFFDAVAPAFRTELLAVSTLLAGTTPNRQTRPEAEALLILADEKVLVAGAYHYHPDIKVAVESARRRLEAAGIDWRSAAIESRYARIGAIARESVTEVDQLQEHFSDKLDRVLTHKVWGVVIFVALMTLMFQSIFTFANVPMDFISDLVDSLGEWVGGLMAEGDLNDLLVNGVISGVGAVIVFLPQIILLFLFISLLEDTGYMARAAFLMDRLMSRVGLHGKSFIPMLSSFACAIPGIMATRTIESPKDRLVTILVAPLMSCSARLPVYTVLIAACIPDRSVLGILSLAGLTMLTMYLLGIVVALIMAWVFKKTLLKGPAPMLIMELPPYKRPVLTVTLRHMWDRSKLFLRRAGTVILGINILLWFMATYPKSAEIKQQFSTRRAAIESESAPADGKSDPKEWATSKKDRLAALDNEEEGEKLRHSVAGHLGKWIEPAIAPLGFDWKMGIGIIGSFAAREVFVSTMSVVYNVGKEKDKEKARAGLAKVMKEQKRPDGSLIYTPLTAVALMVFYVFALQCVSTVAVVRRETNGWKWPLIQWAYMGILAWVLAFVTYQGGKLLGFH